jgi:hypothetical protein
LSGWKFTEGSGHPARNWEAKPFLAPFLNEGYSSINHAEDLGMTRPDRPFAPPLDWIVHPKYTEQRSRLPFISQ